MASRIRLSRSILAVAFVAVGIPTLVFSLLPTRWSAASQTTSDLTVVAGNGDISPLPSATGEIATQASLNLPGGLATDSSGNVLIANTAGNQIDVLARSTNNPGYPIPGYLMSNSWTVGDLYPIAGGGSSSASTSGATSNSVVLKSPTGLALDSEGDVLIADTGDSEVDLLAIASNNPGYPIGSWTPGHLYLYAGGEDTPPSSAPEDATSAKLSFPQGVAVDDLGDVVIADTGHSRVDVVAFGNENPGYEIGTWSSGSIYGIAGGGSGSASSSGIEPNDIRLSSPEDVAIDRSGDLLIDDSGDGAVDALALGNANPGYDSSSWMHGEIYLVAGGGSDTPSYGSIDAGEVALNDPSWISCDLQGNVLIADTYNNEIEVLPVTSLNPGYDLETGASWVVGNVIGITGLGHDDPSSAGTNALATKLVQPGAVSVDPSGAVHIADTADDEVETLALDPEPPTNVTAIPETGAVLVDWNAPSADGGAEISGYEINVTDQFGAPVATIDTDSNSTQDAVSGLGAGTEYGFSVQAENAIGASVSSQLAEVTTAVATTTTAPTSTTTTTPSSAVPSTDLASSPSPPLTSTTSSTTTTTSLPIPTPTTEIATPSPASVDLTHESNPAVRIQSSSSTVTPEAVPVTVACASGNCTGSVELTDRKIVRVMSGGVLNTYVETFVLAAARYRISDGHTDVIPAKLTSVGKQVLSSLVGRKTMATLQISVDHGRTLSQRISLDVGGLKRSR